MKQILFLASTIFSMLCTLNLSDACTVFRSPFAGDSRYSHNVDWFAQASHTTGLVVLNPAALAKRATIFGATGPVAHWTSEWKSIAFTIVGAEFPVSGFNEKGLFMAVLMLPEAQYPPLADPRSAVSTSQFVQYNLDKSSEINQVIDSDKIIRPYSTAFKMHYFVCDASPRCAVLQYVNGALSVYRDLTLPHDVLTNSLYPASASAAALCTDQFCDQSNNSLWRFGQTVLQRNKLSSTGSYIDDAFNILNLVSQNSSVITRFQLTFNPSDNIVYARKFGQQSYASVKIDWPKVNCEATRKFISINSNSHGDLSVSWQELTESIQLSMAVNAGLPLSMATEVGQYLTQATKCM